MGHGYYQESKLGYPRTQKDTSDMGLDYYQASRLGYPGITWVIMGTKGTLETWDMATTRNKSWDIPRLPG